LNTILLAEDSPDDVFIFKSALLKTKLDWALHVVGTGRDVVNYLHGLGHFNERKRYPLPQAVFLDLKLPYLNGFDVLRWIRQQPRFEELVVIILTGSNERQDQEEARKLLATSYLVKPMTSAKLCQELDSLESVRTDRGMASQAKSS
jgi:CheY-like chemotaxis protein